LKLKKKKLEDQPNIFV